MTDEEVFNEIRAKCNDAISYIKESLIEKNLAIGITKDDYYKLNN